MFNKNVRTLCKRKRGLRASPHIIRTGAKIVEIPYSTKYFIQKPRKNPWFLYDLK